jgi:hypothetical protein
MRRALAAAGKNIKNAAGDNFLAPVLVCGSTTYN